MVMLDPNELQEKCNSMIDTSDMFEEYNADEKKLLKELVSEAIAQDDVSAIVAIMF